MMENKGAFFTGMLLGAAAAAISGAVWLATSFRSEPLPAPKRRATPSGRKPGKHTRSAGRGGKRV